MISYRHLAVAIAAALAANGCATSPPKCNPLMEAYKANQGMSRAVSRIKGNVSDYGVAGDRRTAALSSAKSLVGDVPLNQVGEPVSQQTLDELIRQRKADGGVLASQMIDGGCSDEVRDLTNENLPKKWYHFWR